MIKHVSLALTLALGCVSTSALSAEDPIGTRKAIMQSNLAAAKVSGGMMKGEIPFDANVANLALQALNAASLTFGANFPEGSETGMDTKASPKIWEDMAGFQKQLGQFQADAAAAVAAKPGDLDSFKAAFGNVARNCKQCHEGYRVK